MSGTENDDFHCTAFETLEVARDRLREFLPKESQRGIDWSSLTLKPGSLVDPAFADVHADALFRVTVNGAEAQVYCLCERNGRTAADFHVRIFYYLGSIWKRWFYEHPSEPLPPPLHLLVLRESSTGAVNGSEVAGTYSTEAQCLIGSLLPMFRRSLCETSDPTGMDTFTVISILVFWITRANDTSPETMDLMVTKLRELPGLPRDREGIIGLWRYLLLTKREDIDKDVLRRHVREAAATT